MIKFGQNNTLSINKPMYDVLCHIRTKLINGKLSRLRPMGNHVSVPCPFHSNGLERNNSCGIQENGTFHCFTCEAKGKFQTFVAGCLDTSPERAIDWLCKEFQVAKNVVDFGEDIVLNKTKLPNILPESVLDGLQGYCPYLAKRKLSRDTCQHFKVKYDPRTRQVIFPCYDAKDRLVMLARRSIDTKTFLMDAQVEKPVYCLNEVLKLQCKRLLLVEGLIDTLTGWEYGFPTVGLLGEPSTQQIRQINNSGVNIIYLATDNDGPGERFRKLLKQQLNPGILIFDIRFPKGKKDINDLEKNEFISLFHEQTKNYAV